MDANAADKADALVLPLSALRLGDEGIAGAKNASLGELISQLAREGVCVPEGFAITVRAFRMFLDENHLTDWIDEQLRRLDIEEMGALARCGALIRERIERAPLPPLLEQAVRAAFAQLETGAGGSYAVRSSAIAGDFPAAALVGQQETFLNVRGIEAVLAKTRSVFASLYNDCAIAQSVQQGPGQSLGALSVAVQRMARSDLGSAGVMFTLDTESGFSDVFFITASFGLGENVAQGAVNPDEFFVFKPSLAAGKFPIVRRALGSKLLCLEFAPEGSTELVRNRETNDAERARFSLSDAEVIELARLGAIIERHYGCAMDIEWGKDALEGRIYILQARPETLKSRALQSGRRELRYRLTSRKGEALVSGRAIGQKIGVGTVRMARAPQDLETIMPGDVLVADRTDPHWEPVMQRAGAVVTNRGGRTCHAAIIARELGIPAVVGCGDATERLREGQMVTVSCAEGDTGFVYAGLLPMEVTEVERGTMPKLPVRIMMNVGNPSLAFDFAQLPNEGVGLARIEFIINHIGIHPLSVLGYERADAELRAAIDSAARGYASPREFFIAKLTEGIASIAAAFYPKPVLVRLSDFKSNEYRKLLGGSRFEPQEENPMLGFRGAARYIAPGFAGAFAMECEALRRAREDMGLSNIEITVPFVRTLDEGRAVTGLLRNHGLERGKNGLCIHMMCELPANALLADEFLDIFDGFSIGTNDLTQLTLGIDRDCSLVAHAFDEANPAVLKLLEIAIAAAQRRGRMVGICGQGPSDNPAFAQWLLARGVSSLSLNPDSVVPTWKALAQ